MSARTVCPDCQKIMRLPANLPAGKRVVCPGCGSRFVPSTEEEAPKAEAPTPEAPPAVARSSKPDSVVLAKQPAPASPAPEPEPVAPAPAPTPKLPQARPRPFHTRPVGMAVIAAVVVAGVGLAVAIWANQSGSTRQTGDRSAKGGAAAPSAPVTDKLGDPKETEEDQALRKRQAEYQQLLVQGNAALADQRHEAAIKAYEAASKLFPEQVEPAQGLASARAALARGKLGDEKLKADIAKLLEDGKTALDEKKFDQAVSAFEAVLRLDPSDATAVKGLADARDALKSPDSEPTKTAPIKNPPDPRITLGQPPKDKDKLKDKDEDPPSYIGGKTLVQWIADLKHPDASVRQNAVRTIVNFGPPAKLAVPALINALREPDTSLRGDAAAALGMLAAMERGIELDDVPKVIQALSGLLGTVEYQRSVRLQATLAIAQFGSRGRGAVPTLASNVTDSQSWELRKALCYALGRIGADPNKGPDSLALTTLYGRLKDPVAPVRLEAILALSAMGTSRNTAEVEAEKRALEGVLNDVDKNVAIWARVLLMFLDEKLVTEKSLAQLGVYLQKDTDPKIRAAAARAIGTLGPRAKSRIPDLMNALRDKDLEVILTVIGALGLMSEVAPERIMPELDNLLKDAEAPVRAHTLRVLSNLGKQSRQSVPKMVPLLKDKDNTVVYAAIAAFANLGELSDPALPSLRDLAKNHRNEDIQNAAEEAIKIVEKATAKKKP